MRWTKGKHPWTCIDRDLDFGTLGCSASVVTQPRVGYVPTGGVGLVLLIVVVLVLVGRL